MLYSGMFYENVSDKHLHIPVKSMYDRINILGLKSNPFKYKKKKNKCVWKINYYNAWTVEVCTDRFFSGPSRSKNKIVGPGLTCPKREIKIPAWNAPPVAEWWRSKLEDGKWRPERGETGEKRRNWRPGFKTQSRLSA